MKRANQPGVGASLAGCVDFDYFTAAGRGIGLCPSANRASELKQNVMLAWLPVPQPRNCHAGSIPSTSATSKLARLGVSLSPGHKAGHKRVLVCVLRPSSLTTHLAERCRKNIRHYAIGL
jgi:hypothetical protein